MATRILNCLDGVGDLDQLARGGFGISDAVRLDEFHGLSGVAAAGELGHAPMIPPICPIVKPLQLGAVAARVHMIKLTETREITPYVWIRTRIDETA